MDSLKPPLQNTAGQDEPQTDDLEKIRKWQEERIARKLRGEYESAVQHLAELINGNLSTPVRIASVRVEGATNTRSSFLGWLINPWLQRNSSVDADSVSNLQSVLHTTRGISHMLQETDIFQSIEAKLEKSRSALSGDNDVDVIFNTREKGRFYVKTATELGNSEGNASATARVRNAFGGAELFEANMSFGTKTRRSFHALFSLPITPDLKTKSEFTIFGLERDISSYASATEGLKGVKAVVRRGTHEFAYEAVLRHIGNLSPSASLSMRERAGQTIKSSVSHTWVQDDRDDRITASRGLYTRFFQEFAGLGGDASFYKSEAETQISRPLAQGVNLSFAGRTGLLWSFSGQSLFSDRFQLGGPLSVRSFKVNTLGPRDGTDSLGGDLYWSAGLSLISDLPRKPHWPVKSHFFVNAGRLDSMDKSKTVAENFTDCLSKPSVSAGLGLIYRFDPVRVEVNFGVPLVASKSDGIRRGFQVGIGLDFL